MGPLWRFWPGTDTSFPCLVFRGTHTKNRRLRGVFFGGGGSLSRRATRAMEGGRLRSTVFDPRQEVRNILADMGLTPQNREEKLEARLAGFGRREPKGKAKSSLGGPIPKRHPAELGGCSRLSTPYWVDLKGSPGKGHPPLFDGWPILRRT